MPGVIHAHFVGQFTNHRQHPHPFGKDDDLARGLFQQLGKHAFEFFKLGADTALGIENGRRVADHAHAGEILLHAVEFFLGQRAALGYGGKPLRQIFIIAIATRLFFDHGHEESLLRATRQLTFDIAFLRRNITPERRRCNSSRFL